MYGPEALRIARFHFDNDITYYNFCVTFHKSCVLEVVYCHFLNYTTHMV